jgi:antitoxin (DNA-binding transcriptional repressor) of toxin-antitoxin stability system
MDTESLDEIAKRLDEFAHRVAQGETIVVARDGEPVLDVVPRAGSGKCRSGLDLACRAAFKRVHGIDKIVTYNAPDFDDPLPVVFLITPLPEPAPR